MSKSKVWLLLPVIMAFSNVWAEEPAQSAGSKISVEIKIGTGIEKFDPTGIAATFPASVPQLVGWTRVTGALAPVVITHVWILNGEEKAAIELPVKSSTYRTWSRKSINGQTGKWRLDVKGPDGTVIGSQEFEVVKEGAAPAQKPAESPTGTGGTTQK